MKLSILIPTVPSRKQSYTELIGMLEAQATDDVQIIGLYDNKHWSVGTKRNKLLDMAEGEYITYIDDDDVVYDDYIKDILEAMKGEPDLITFDVFYTSDRGHDFVCEYKDGQRPAHVHVWKRQNFKPFVEINTGEDVGWVKDNLENVKVTHHICKVLYHYRFSYDRTEAQR